MQSPEARIAVEPEIKLSEIKILIVDHYEPARRLLDALLRKIGCEKLVFCDDAFEALNLVDQHGFDLIASNVDVPHGGGFKLLREVRSDAKLRHLAVVLMNSNPNHRGAALQAGADGFLMECFAKDDVQTHAPDVEHPWKLHWDQEAGVLTQDTLASALREAIVQRQTRRETPHFEEIAAQRSMDFRLRWSHWLTRT